MVKIVGIHWFYHIESPVKELIVGYYNTTYRNGFQSIVVFFEGHGKGGYVQDHGVPKSGDLKKYVVFKYLKEFQNFFHHFSHPS